MCAWGREIESCMPIEKNGIFFSEYNFFYLLKSFFPNRKCVVSTSYKYKYSAIRVYFPFCKITEVYFSHLQLTR